MQTIFLTADWRKLIMVNYQVDPELLQPYLPAGTSLDFWEGKCYVSLVGFLFQNTRIKGFKVPFHVNFEEVNLRFYVTFLENGILKRGVVFISEIVPRRALTLIANGLYGESYSKRKMSYLWSIDSTELTISYRWQEAGEWQEFGVTAVNKPMLIDKDSHQGFITEHYWGYSKRGSEKTTEYGVEHPTWESYPISNHHIDVNFEKAYGKKFSHLTRAIPSSVLLAEGSDVIIRSGKKWVFPENK